MHKYLYILFFLIFKTALTQELNCNVVVNAQQTGNENVQVFKTLERQLKEFVNNTQWTNSSYKTQERIDCTMVINITDYDTDRFQATLQVQSSALCKRPALLQNGGPHRTFWALTSS